MHKHEISTTNHYLPYDLCEHDWISPLDDNLIVALSHPLSSYRLTYTVFSRLFLFAIASPSKSFCSWFVLPFSKDLVQKCGIFFSEASLNTFAVSKCRVLSLRFNEKKKWLKWENKQLRVENEGLVFFLPKKKENCGLIQFLFMYIVCHWHSVLLRLHFSQANIQFNRVSSFSTLSN